MKASKQGIEVTKAELSALLFFAGKHDSAAVKFRVDSKGKLIVGATDGKRAVECESSAGDHEGGEWTVPGDYLELLRRGANKGRTDVLLKVNSKGLKHALLVGAASRDPAQEVVDKKNGTSTQVSMESLHTLFRKVPLQGSWFAIVPKHVNKALDVVSKAADGCPITLYPPQSSEEHVLFECSSEAGRWRGKIQPAVVLAPGDEAPKADDGEADEPLFAKGKPAEEEEEPEDDGSGIVEDDYGTAKKKTAKKGRKKS